MIANQGAVVDLRVGESGHSPVSVRLRLWGNVGGHTRRRCRDEAIQHRWGSPRRHHGRSCWKPSKLFDEIDGFSFDVFEQAVGGECRAVIRLYASPPVGRCPNRAEVAVTSISGIRIEKSLGMRTRASYTAVVAWGGKFAEHLNHHRAHFR